GPPPWEPTRPRPPSPAPAQAPAAGRRSRSKAAPPSAPAPRPAVCAWLLSWYHPFLSPGWNRHNFQEKYNFYMEIIIQYQTFEVKPRPVRIFRRHRPFAALSRLAAL